MKDVNTIKLDMEINDTADVMIRISPKISMTTSLFRKMSAMNFLDHGENKEIIQKAIKLKLALYYFMSSHKCNPSDQFN